MKIANRIKLACLVMSLAAVYSFNSLKAEELKIAVVDLQKIEMESVFAKDLRNKIQQKENELQGNLLKKKDKIEADYKAIEAKKAVLSREELEKKIKLLEKDANQLQMDERLYGQMLEVAKMDALGVMQKEVQKAVDKNASKHDIVFPTNVMLAYNPTKFNDITTKVLETLNKNIKVSNFDKIFANAKKQVEEMFKKQTQNAKKK